MNVHLYDDGLNSNFKEVCIITLDGEIWAHKAYLGTAFGYFKEFFEGDEFGSHEYCLEANGDEKDKGKEKESLMHTMCEIHRDDSGYYTVIIRKSYTVVNLLMMCVYGVKIDKIIGQIENKCDILAHVLDLLEFWAPNTYFSAVFKVYYEKEILDSILFSSGLSEWHHVIQCIYTKNVVFKNKIKEKLVNRIYENNRRKYSKDSMENSTEASNTCSTSTTTSTSTPTTM